MLLWDAHNLLFPLPNFSHSLSYPVAPFSSAVGLAEIGAALNTLPTVFILATLPSSVPHTAIGSATSALRAAGHGTPLATAMGHTKFRATMHTPRADPSTAK